MSDSKDATGASFLKKYKDNYTKKQSEEMSLTDYLERCKGDKMAYANAAERLLAAIGEPEIVDTAQDKGPDGRVFHNKKIARYDAFSDFYGMEDSIQQIVSHIKGAANGGEFKKQVLFLLGPVGGGKSSLGERLKELMEKNPIYVLRDKKTGVRSPAQDSPLALLGGDESLRAEVSKEFGIAERYLKVQLSPWAVKRLKEADGDIDAAFDVEKVWPSEDLKIGVSKIEPADANNQDTSDLVGKVNLNKLGEGFDEDDTDAYLYSAGSLCVANQGLMEFVEMFKVGSIKALNPILEATQSGKFKSNCGMGSIPFTGLIVAHTNESEYDRFMKDKKNEAIAARINVVKVPYTLRMSEEAKIYQKVLDNSENKNYAIAPKTIDLLAEFSAATRMPSGEGFDKYDPDVRVKVYSGEIPEGASDGVPSLADLEKLAEDNGAAIGMDGFETRDGFKVLEAMFNARANDGEHAGDPILLFETLESYIRSNDKISREKEQEWLGYINGFLKPKHEKFIVGEITEAFTDASDDMCQAMFDNYYRYADAWVHNESLEDREVTTGVLNRTEIERYLGEFEKAAGIKDPKSFRSQTVGYIQREMAKNGGSMVKWSAYQPMAEAIRGRLQVKVKDIMPVIRFDAMTTDEDAAKDRDTFMKNMEDKGYTMPMIKRAVSVFQNTIA